MRTVLLLALAPAAVAQSPDDPLAPWRQGVKIRLIAPDQSQHPESPDGPLDMYGGLPYNRERTEETTVSEAARVAAKTARLEARLTDEQKALLQHAADLTGRSLTEFVVSSAQEVAARTVREHKVLTLSGRDRQVFLDALLKPTPPNKRLRQAASRYKKASGL